VIRVEGLSKRFTVRRRHAGRFGALRSLFDLGGETVRAVDGVDFAVEEGELVGYLGPNGAGKSTTIKMLTGLLVPSAGRVEVNGFVPWRERRRYVAEIGAVFGQRSSLWWDLPVIESLELLRHVYRVPEARFRKNYAEFVELLELGPFLDTPTRALSLGQRMRADLCAALLHEPKLLFLDEPTIGLDVVAKERIRRFVLHLNAERGTTVLLTTHDLADVQRLCRRVMIIDRGRLLYDGDLEALQERFGGRRRLVVDFVEAPAEPAIAGAELLELRGARAVYAFDRRELSASELIGRLAARHALRDLAVEEPDIEATVRNIYEGRLLEGAGTRDTIEDGS
jgi:ABC-2 type transport system ATP-binding protein